MDFRILFVLGKKVLDGRNRALACKLAGVEPTYIMWKTQNGLSPFTWVISQNAHRRNLTASQLAAIAWELKALFSGPGKENVSAGGKGLPILVKVNSVEQAAKMVGASKGYVIEVEKIHKKGPALIPQIKAGELSIQEALVRLGLDGKTGTGKTGTGTGKANKKKEPNTDAPILPVTEPVEPETVEPDAEPKPETVEPETVEPVEPTVEPGEPGEPGSNGRYFWRQIEVDHYDDNGQQSRKMRWGWWKEGAEPSEDNCIDTSSECEYAKKHADELAADNIANEESDRLAAEEIAEDDRKAIELAERGIVVPRHDPKVERLCKLVVSDKFKNKKKAIDLAKGLLKPDVKPEKSPEEEDAENAEFNEYDREVPKGKGTYTVTLTVAASRLATIQKEAEAVFGEMLLGCTKVEHASSRAETLAQAASQVEDVKSTVEELKMELENWKEGLPENLQNGEKANQLDEAISGLEAITNVLDDVDFSVEFPGMY